MTRARRDGLKVFQELLPGVVSSDVNELRDGGFADELSELSIDHVFGSLWTRSGLNRRDRSLVTLGALIAMRASNEIGVHMSMALRNGLSVEEIEEVVYHLTAYAGFPAANAARSIGRDVLPRPERASDTVPQDPVRP